MIEGLKKHREKILEMTKELGISQIRVFGSALGANFAPESDIDFLVKIPSGTTLFRLLNLVNRLEGLLGRKVDLLDEEEISPYIRRKILKEASPL